MSFAQRRLVDSQWVRENAAGVTAAVTLLAYALVFGTFLGAFPYPPIGVETVDLLGTVIAVLNTGTVAVLGLGWYWARRGRVRRHRNTMLVATALILLFLVVYLQKVGGGGVKSFVGPEWVKTFVYFPLLGVHELLSALAVPLVVYTLVLGLTHSPAELRETPHPRVGRWAAGIWMASLTLGVVSYLLLNVVYAWEYTTSVPF